MGSTSSVPLSAVLAIACSAAGARRAAVGDERVDSPESTWSWRAARSARDDAVATIEQSEAVAVSDEGEGVFVREIICVLA